MYLSAARVAEFRKFLVAVAGVLAQVLAVGVLHGAAEHWAQVAAGGVAALLVYVVPNGPGRPAQVG